MTLSQHMMKSQKVTVADIKDIEQMIVKVEGQLTAIDARDKQMEAVSALSCQLQSTMDSAGDRQALRDRSK